MLSREDRYLYRAVYHDNTLKTKIEAAILVSATNQPNSFLSICHLYCAYKDPRCTFGFACFGNVDFRDASKNIAMMSIGDGI